MCAFELASEARPLSDWDPVWEPAAGGGRRNEAWTSPVIEGRPNVGEMGWIIFSKLEFVTIFFRQGIPCLC